LTEWEDRAACHLGKRYRVSPNALRAGLDVSERSADLKKGGPYWLSVVVRRGNALGDPYLVTGWLSAQKGRPGAAGQRLWPLLAGGEALPASAEQLAEDQEQMAEPPSLSYRLAELRRAALAVLRAERLVVPEDQFRIEIFLPIPLLSRALDQCHLPQGLRRDPLPVGRHHPLVVRCLERWTYEEYGMPTRVRWGHIAQEPGPLSVVEKLPAEEYAAFLLEQPLLLNEAQEGLRDSRRVVCVLTGRPLPDGEEACQFWYPILEAGVPVVVWLRHPDAGGQSTLKALVGPGIQQLHHEVWMQRHQYQRQQPKHHPSQNIGLLYEDPTRVPPELLDSQKPPRFSAPAR
jgi:hypothetical protein